jgi:hypothetical protein
MELVLVLVSQFGYAAQFSNSSQYKLLQALLFPLALAVVELARVPLAICVRTQTSWNMKLAALIGVSCAVIVTTVSLSQIGHSTFNPRLEAVHEKQNALLQSRTNRQGYVEQNKAAQALLDQAIKTRDDASQAHQTAVHELNAHPSQNCSPYQKPNPSPYGGPPITGQTCKENPAFKPLKAEMESAGRKLADAEAAVKQAQANVAKYADPRALDQADSKAEQEMRDAIYQSPLHSYTAMLFQADPREVTDGQVKTLEWYLILIPSIAAALSSTLIAMTAVRRLKQPTLEVAPTIPDEAAAYLFGPLVGTINQQIRDAVTAAKAPAPAG